MFNVVGNVDILGLNYRNWDEVTVTVAYFYKFPKHNS